MEFSLKSFSRRAWLDIVDTLPPLPLSQASPPSVKAVTCNAVIWKNKKQLNTFWIFAWKTDTINYFSCVYLAKITLAIISKLHIDWLGGRVGGGRGLLLGSEEQIACSHQPPEPDLPTDFLSKIIIWLMADILPVFGPNCRNKYILTSSFGSINIEFIGRVVKFCI